MKGGKDMSVQEEIADRFNVSAERLRCMIEEEKKKEEGGNETTNKVKGGRG